MQHYYGTKHIAAKPMTRAAYNEFRGWTLPSDENGADGGYLVEYLDGGKPNTLNYKGYVSWSPQEQFEKAYQPFDALNFGHALEVLKAGGKVARAGWNGKGMWLELVREIHEVARNGGTDGPAYRLTGRDDFEPLPWIGMKTADNKFVPWLASQTDVLADDWQVIQ